MTAIPPVDSTAPARGNRDAELRAAAEKVEAAFLAEMLKSAGFGKARETIGGGAGESQFASFLVDAQAERIVAAGGVGLAETIFNALKEQDHDM